MHELQGRIAEGNVTQALSYLRFGVVVPLVGDAVRVPNYGGVYSSP